MSWLGAGRGFGGGVEVEGGLGFGLDGGLEVVVGVFPGFVDEVGEGLFVGGFLVFGDGGEGSVGGVEGDFVDRRGRRSGLAGGFGEVGGGDLEGVEEEAGAAGVEVVGGEAADDFAQAELDGGAGFGLGEGEEGLAAAAAAELGAVAEGLAGGVVLEAK